MGRNPACPSYVWLMPCMLAQMEHTPSSHAGAQAKWPHPPRSLRMAPADDLWLPINFIQMAQLSEHLLCGRASCNICSDIWSDSSGDRLGLQRDRHLDFCCLGKASLPMNSSESKQTFSLPSAIAPKCGRALPGPLASSTCRTLLFWLRWRERRS